MYFLPPATNPKAARRKIVMNFILKIKIVYINFSITKYFQLLKRICLALPSLDIRTIDWLSVNCM